MYNLLIGGAAGQGGFFSYMNLRIKMKTSYRGMTYLSHMREGDDRNA